MLILLVIAYLLGSIPWSFLVTRLRLKIDIREVGSGNPGATNVFRVDKKLALLVLILDVAKSSVFLWVCKSHGLDNSTLCLLGLFSVIGHVIPVWLKFKGGKGVATALGALVVVSPEVMVIFTTIWAISFIVFRYPSLSSIMAIVGASIGMFFFESIETSVIFTAIAAIVLAKHKSNIIRLVKRKEHGL